MTNDECRPGNAADPRRQAEEIARGKATRSSPIGRPLQVPAAAGFHGSPEEARSMLHELQVHQIELELQNEELRRAQLELDAVRARYFDLYDLAPVGYCTLSKGGLILEANLIAVALLGVARGELIKQPITRFVFRDDQDIYLLHRKRILETGKPQACDLRMQGRKNAPFWAHLETTAAQDTAGAPVLRMVMIDITERMQVEASLYDSGQAVDAVLAKYEQVISMIADVIWRYEVDARGQFVAGYISPVADRLLGLPAGTIGDSFDKFFSYVYPEDLPAVQEMLSSSLTSIAQDVTKEYRMQRPDGTTLWVRSNGSACLQQNGHVVGSGISSDITEGKRREEELLRSEEALRRQNGLLSSLLKTLPLGVFMVETPSGKPLLANEAACTLLGRGILPQASKLDLAEVYQVRKQDSHDPYPAKEMPILLGMSGETAHVDDMLVLRPDGTESLLEVFGSPVMDEQGRTWAALATFLDITARKKAEADLRESEARFDQLAEQSRVFAWEVDAQGLYTYVSHVAERVCGYRPEEMVGRMHFYDLHPCSEREAFKTAAFAAFAKGEPFQGLVNSIVTKDDRLVWVSTNGIPLLSADGTLRGYRGGDTDITERRMVEEQLRQLSRAVEQSPASIVITNPHGDIEYVNPKFIDITGYTREEALGKNPRILKSGESDPEVYRELWDTLAAGREWRGELHNKRKDGGLYWESASISPIRDPSGRITHFLAVKEDITARKQAEEELREINRSLADANTRANAMADEADRANEAKGEFLANMSHEIRTPMNGVIGMTGLLLDTELSEEQRRYAEVVRNSGEALLALLNDILDFSKIEAGKLEMEMLDFDLRALLHDFSATGALCAHEKGIAFICAADRNVPAHLRGDPGRLRQVLTNLTGNAVKFTHQGEIAVRVGLVFETAEAALVRFSIKDTGIGIPAEKREFLFQKFTQADASTTRRYGGTGLGLAISKQLVEMMGGEIGVVSAEGRGSEFWFTARLAKQAERTPKESHPPADLRGTHILIVDDNAATRQVLMAQLQASGVRAEEVPDSTAALQELRRAGNAGDPFQAAVVDLQMPGMDGSELARAIKSDEMLRDTRLVLMTSLGQRGDARKMEEIGFAAYLTKPVRQDEIIGCLSAVLAGAAGEPPPPIVTRHAIRELRRGAVRILLAEDNITNQQVAVGLLKRLGLRADAVANGAEAIEALESLPYDLVLMDVQMPVLDGLEATRQIRDPHSAVLNHEIPIIAMTANAMQSDRNECLDAGMNDYVSKPVSRPALAEALDKWLPKEAAITQEESDRRKAA